MVWRKSHTREKGSDRLSIESVDPSGLARPPGPFAHVAVADGRRTVYISGQVAFDERGDVVGRGDAGEQARQCLRNIDLALRAVGGGRERVARIGVFLTNMDDRPAVGEARSEYVGEHRPSSTLVGVASLVHPDLLVEIEAVAVLD
jgi:enamine deaminase RidA (YjgF/YER057c/UK114 family)